MQKGWNKGQNYLQIDDTVRGPYPLLRSSRKLLSSFMNAESSAWLSAFILNRSISKSGRKHTEARDEMVMAVS